MVLTSASGDGPNISLGLSETPVQDRPRVHLDLYTSDQDAEVDHLVSLGASRVEWHNYPEGADFVVLADTEGNRSSGGSVSSGHLLGRRTSRSWTTTEGSEDV